MATYRFQTSRAAACRGEPSWPTSAWVSPASRWARCCTATASPTTRAAWSPPNGQPHFAPKAKSVIWLFMIGGVSHLESFDPKPAAQQVRRQVDRRNAVQERARQEVPRRERPHRRARPAKDPARSSIRCRSASESAARAASKSATGGRTSAAASTTSPSSARCGPTTSTTAPSSSSTPAATGSTASFPRSAPGSTTAWARSTKTCRSSSCWAPRRPIAAAARKPTAPITSARARRRAARGRPGQPARRWPAAARRLIAKSSKPSSTCSSGSTGSRWPSIRTTRRRWRGSSRTSWRSACSGPFPKCSSSSKKPPHTQKLYGLDNDTTAPFAKHCLAARRLVERGVRFVQIYPRRQRRRRRLGRPRRSGKQPRHQLRPSRQADRRAAAGSQAARHARRDARRLGHRVRPHARHRRRRRPRPPSLRLLRLDGRRRHQGRRRPRRDRRARLLSRREPPLRHRHPRHRAAPARPRLAPARNSRPQAAGDRTRPRDPRHHRVARSYGRLLGVAF